MKDAWMRKMKMVFGAVSVFPKPDGCKAGSTEGISVFFAAQPCIFAPSWQLLWTLVPQV